MPEETSQTLLELPLPPRDGYGKRIGRYFQRRWKQLTAAAALLAGVLAIGGHILGGVAGIWEFYHAFVGQAATRQESRRADAMPLKASPANFRSLAVLPIEGKSPDEVETARDLTRNLALSMRRAYPDMFVASNSAVQSALQPSRDAHKIANELNVRYVVEGTFRQDQPGGELAVELIDATDGAQLWATTTSIESDRMQAVARVRTAIRNVIVEMTKQELASLPENRQAAWNLVLEAWNEDSTIDGYKRRQRLFERALKVDPEFPQALRGLSDALWQRLQDEPERYTELVKVLDETSSHAVRAAPTDPRVWLTRAVALRLRRNMTAAFAASDEAMRLDSYEPAVLTERAGLFIYSGHPIDALPLLDRAERLDGSNVTMTSVYIWRCVAYFNLQRNQDAIGACEKAAGLWNRWVIYAFLVCLHAQQGNAEKAAFWKSRLLEANPNLTLRSLRQLVRLNSDDPEFIAAMERWIAGLQKSGIPY